MGQYQDNLFLKRKLRERLERQLRDDAIPASAISAELVTGYRGIYNRVFKRWLDFVLALALFVVTTAGPGGHLRDDHRGQRLPGILPGKAGRLSPEAFPHLQVPYYGAERRSDRRRHDRTS